MTSLTPVAALVGHTKAVNAIGWSPYGTQLSTVDGNGEFRLWDISGLE
jgi:WD40 repeat protein